MLVLLFRSGLAHGDVFGGKKHQKQTMAAFQKAGAVVSNPVSLNKTQEGYWSNGRWVALPAKSVNGRMESIAGSKEGDKAVALPGASKGPETVQGYQEPAKVSVKGDKWTFTESNGRVVGFVRWVSEGDVVPPGSRAEE
jgi:hypothetical protein